MRKKVTAGDGHHYVLMIKDVSMKYLPIVFVLLLSCTCLSVAQEKKTRQVLPAKKEREIVPIEVMNKIYEKVKTPFKYGIVLKGEKGTKVDSPSVFRHGDKWYMVYIIFNGRGYETAIAESTDLLNWRKLGKILPFRENTWDATQAAGYIALQDHVWGGSYKLHKYDDKYWMSYLGGSLKGYETDPLAIGMAWTKYPMKPVPWTRLNAPVLTRDQSDCRYWEKVTQYKSNIIQDESKSLGWLFVMFYNAKTKSGYECIGIAVSNDMAVWHRYGTEPIIDNGEGLSGDPQVVLIDDVWVMFYFGAFWKPKAFDTFACSYNLVHWTKWSGTHLVEPSEPWDNKYAHKPWVVVYNDIVYHFYNAVGNEGRVIALATSKDLKTDKKNNQK